MKEGTKPRGVLPVMACMGRLQVYERVDISPVKVYKRVGKSVVWVCKRVQKGKQINVMVLKSRENFLFL